MQRALTFPLFVLFLLCSPLASALDLTFKQVAPGIYASIGELGLLTYENEGMNGNAGFIVTEAGVVVVDSGSSFQVAQKIHAAIRQVTQQPVKYVINTGGQDHRWLGNGYFKAQGAEIIANTKAVTDMAARGDMQLSGLTSFEEIAKLQPKLIVPGHGEVCDLTKAQGETADYLRLLLDHMVKAVNQGKDLQTAIDSLDQSAFAKLPNYDLLKGGNANRVYLEAESL